MEPSRPRTIRPKPTTSQSSERSNITRRVQPQPQSHLFIPYDETGKRVSNESRRAIQRHVQKSNFDRQWSIASRPIEASHEDNAQQDTASPSRIQRSLPEFHTLPAQPPQATSSRAPLLQDVHTFPAQQPSRFQTSRFDPFGVLPIAYSAVTDAMIRYYHESVINSTTLFSDMRRSWFRLSIANPSFFRVKLCHAASNLLHRDGNSSDPALSQTALAHRIEAIGMIQQRLNYGDFSIATMAGVAAMLCYEAHYGSPDTMRIHADGLLKLMHARGMTVESMPSRDMKALLSWSYLESAIALVFTPPASQSHSADEVAERQNLIMHLLDSDVTSYGSAYNLDDIFSQIRDLSAVASSPASPVYRGDFALSDAVNKVLQKFVYSAAEFYTTDYASAAVCLAGLIYTNCYLRNQKPQLAMIRRLVVELVRILSLRTPATATDDQTPVVGAEDTDGAKAMDRQIWVLVVGGMVSLQTAEEGFFVQRLRTLLLDELRLSSWADVEERLRRVCWLTTPVISAGNRLWDSVVRARPCQLQDNALSGTDEVGPP